MMFINEHKDYPELGDGGITTSDGGCGCCSNSIPKGEYVDELKDNIVQTRMFVERVLKRNWQEFLDTEGLK